jgi:signal transduction histidine kinase
MEKLIKVRDQINEYCKNPKVLPDNVKREINTHLSKLSSLLDKHTDTSRDRIVELINISKNIGKGNYDIAYIPSNNNDELDLIGEALEKIAALHGKELKNSKNTEVRLHELMDVMMSFAQLDFSVSAPVTEDENEFDAIAFGLNTLGQELSYYKTQLEAKTASLEEAQRIGKIGSWTWDLETLAIEGSKEFYNIYELPLDEKITKNTFDNIIPKKDNEHLAVLASNCIEKGIPYSHTYPATTRTSKLKHLKAFGELIIQEGKPYQIIGTIHDITEIQEAKLALDDLNVGLEKKVAERTADLESFTYSVSHDLRAPLRAINGFSEIIEEDYAAKLDDEGKRLLAIIRSNSNRMSNLIDDLLRFSRLNNQTISKHPIDMRAMIDELVGELIPAYPDLEIQFNIGDLPTIYCDSMLLKQVWQNLIDNAIKYSSTREIINISIEKQDTDSQYDVISIKDNGVGFEQQYEHKLFEVFQRLHSQNEFTGTGVGLSIVKRIIDKHQGKITAESEINIGSTFYISIPKNK